MLRLRRLKVKLYYCWKRERSSGLLRGRKPEVHNSTRLNERHAFRVYDP